MIQEAQNFLLKFLIFFLIQGICTLLKSVYFWENFVEHGDSFRFGYFFIDIHCGNLFENKLLDHFVSKSFVFNQIDNDADILSIIDIKNNKKVGDKNNGQDTEIDNDDQIAQ